MNKKKLWLLLSKVPEDKREDFLRDLRRLGEEALALYGVTLTDDEQEFLRAPQSETLTDETIAEVSGCRPPPCGSSNFCDAIYNC